MKIRTSACTDTGRIKPRNEDSFACLTDLGAQFAIEAILIVADGIGGNAAGDVASKMAVDGILTSLLGHKCSYNIRDQNSFLGVFKSIISDVNVEIHRAGQTPEQAGMGTTCTAGVIVENGLFLTHVGDSRAYLYRDAHLHQLTVDHSWVEEEIRKGTITPEAARSHPYRRLITRAIGPSETVIVDVYTECLQTNDVVLICTDGLTTMLDEKAIRAILDDEDACHAAGILCDEANKRGGLDNTTAVVARVEMEEVNNYDLTLSHSKPPD